MAGEWIGRQVGLTFSTTTECPESSAPGVILIIVIIILAVAAILFLLRSSFGKKSADAVIVKLLINHIQVVGLFKKGRKTHASIRTNTTQKHTNKRTNAQTHKTHKRTNAQTLDMP